jgi:hypothetical protein
MVNVSLVRYLGWAALILLIPRQGFAQDDFEAALLKKFQKQNDKAGLQAKADVEKTLALAVALSPKEPEKALDLLRQARELLADADQLARAEKDALARKLDDAARDAKARLQSKQEQAKSQVPNGEVQGGTIIFQPNIAPVKIQSTLSATPVVSPDRRWVRIGVRGSFSILSGVNPTPVQVPVPTILQGPGRFFTVIR